MGLEEKKDASVDAELMEISTEEMTRLKKEAEERAARKEAQQRTIVSIEVKPKNVDQDLMALWKKITTSVVQDGLKWGEHCELDEVAYGIYKIKCNFIMGVDNSSDDVVDNILAMKEVQSAEITSMNVV